LPFTPYNFFKKIDYMPIVGLRLNFKYYCVGQKNQERVFWVENPFVNLFSHKKTHSKHLKKSSNYIITSKHLKITPKGENQLVEKSLNI